MEFIKEIIHNLSNIKALVAWGGYIGITAIIFAETGLLSGFFLPGDSLLVTAGIFAAGGYFNIAYLCMLLSVAAILGDSSGYLIGIKTGKKLFTRENSRFFSKDNLFRAKAFYEKYGRMTIIMAKFIPIIRTFAPTVAGVGEMPYLRFLAFSFTGGVLWINSMLLLGYFLGSAIPDIDKNIHYVIAIVIFLSILPIVFKYIKHRMQKAA